MIVKRSIPTFLWIPSTFIYPYHHCLEYRSYRVSDVIFEWGAPICTAHSDLGHISRATAQQEGIVLGSLEEDLERTVRNL